MISRHFFKKSEMIIGLVHDLRKIKNLFNLKFSSMAIRKYVKYNTLRKLQIGAGANPLPGWLATDLYPESNLVVWLDAAKPFPIDDNTFDYVHSEHMIEHIPWHEGIQMLRECRRILKPRGKIRISTPDLKVLLGLYEDKKTLLTKRYIKWITDKFLGDISVYKPSFVINNAFTNYGHRFLYDGELLEMALSKAGFEDIRRYSLWESDDENLRGIEIHAEGLADVELIAFETMVFEGKCPP